MRNKKDKICEITGAMMNNNWQSPYSSAQAKDRELNMDNTWGRKPSISQEMWYPDTSKETI